MINMKKWLSAALASLTLLSSAALFAGCGDTTDAPDPKDTDAVIEEYDVRLSNRTDPVSHLSGGNLQKVILAREIKSAPQLLVAMHPTRGLDVGAIEFIHRKILDAATNGAAVLLVSTELEEIASLSDTVAVMNSGKLSQRLRGDMVNLENLGLLLGGSSLEGGADHA